jgi:peptidyl-prolyl cis-trans isomerase SurA
MEKVGRTPTSARDLLVALILAIAIALASRAEVIDRIAVSVGNDVITTDQINDEIRVSAFLNHTQPSFTADEKREAAERLIEQTLIKREMDFTHYPLPALSDADPMVQKIEAQYPDRQAFLNALASYGIGEDNLRRHLWWQLTLLKCTEERFRPSVEVTSAEIRQYYRQQVEKWREQGVKTIPSFEESRDAMEKALTEERVNQAMDRWLGDARTQMDIRFRNGAFQ